MNDARRLARILPWLTVAWTITWFALLGAHPLFNPDEGRYAEIPREMLASGEWLVPHLNGLVYIEKPPLHYWATAATMALLGSSEWAARLYTGLCGYLTVVVVWCLACRLWGRSTAWQAGLIAASTLLTVLLSHHLTLDTSLTLFMTSMLAGFCLAQRHRDEPARCRRWMRLAWTSAALAMLTKGLIALVLPALSLLVYSILQRDRAVWRRLSLLSGFVIFIGIAAPWFCLVQREVPQFLRFFFVREHFARYLTTISERYEPWWFFIPVLLAGSLPWIVPAARAIVGGWRANTSRGNFDVRRFLWVWVVVTLVFFSASESKLIPYIQPIFPALALLIASGEYAKFGRDLRITAIILAGAAFLGLIAIALPPSSGAQAAHVAPFQSLRSYGFVMAAIALSGGALALVWHRRLFASSAAIAAAAYLCFATLLLGARTVSSLYSGATLAEQLPRPLAAGIPIFSVRTYDQTLPFYMRRTVILVEEHGELDFGVALAPGKNLPSMAEFESRWRRGGQALAVLEPQTYDELQRAGLPMVLRAVGPDRQIVSRQ